MLYKVLSINDKMLKMLFGNLDLHTPNLPDPRFKAMNSLKKKALLLISGALGISSTSLSQVDPKVPLGHDGNLEVPFSGSPSHKEAYKTSEKCQATCPSTPLHEPRLTARGSSKREVRALRIFFNPTATLQPHRRAASLPSLLRAPCGPPTQAAQTPCLRVAHLLSSVLGGGAELRLIK